MSSDRRVPLADEMSEELQDVHYVLQSSGIVGFIEAVLYEIDIEFIESATTDLRMLKEYLEKYPIPEIVVREKTSGNELGF